MHHLSNTKARQPEQRWRFIAGQLVPTCGRAARAVFCRTVEEASFLFRPRPEPSTAIIVAGSERSGTTWLARLIASLTGTQLILEPFGPEAAASPLLFLRKNGTSIHRQDSLSRRYLHRESVDSQTQRAICLVLSGRRRSFWTDILSDQVAPTRHLIKAVHANLMLGFLTRRFRPAIFYLRRNPLAVLASRQRGFGGAFRDALLPGMLAQPELQDKFPESLVVRMLAEENWLARHAIEWAIENGVAGSESAAGGIHCIHYESLVSNPRESLHRIAEILHANADLSSIDVDRVTHTSVLRYDNRYARLHGGRDQLARSDVNRIADWFKRLEPFTGIGIEGELIASECPR